MRGPSPPGAQDYCGPIRFYKEAWQSTGSGEGSARLRSTATDSEARARTPVTVRQPHLVPSPARKFATSTFQRNVAHLRHLSRTYLGQENNDWRPTGTNDVQTMEGH